MGDFGGLVEHAQGILTHGLADRRLVIFNILPDRRSGHN